MVLNNIGVLRHESKTLEKNCHKAALFQRIFFDGAHLTGKLFDDAFHEKKNKSRSEKEVGSHRLGFFQGGGQE